MKIENSPGAYGWLAGMLVMLCGLLLNASCGRMPYDGSMRTPDQRTASAVEIFTECGTGSGVLVDETHVLTAFHVVNCESWPLVGVANWIAIRTLDKQTSIASVQVGDGTADLARLELVTAIKDTTPVTIREARLGETLCAVTARPERAFRCGYVETVGGPREQGDVFVKKMNVWYDNSGSGVYGEDGALVGIAVRLSWCSAGEALIYMLTDERVATCAGRVSSISNSPVRG